MGLLLPPWDESETGRLRGPARRGVWGVGTLTPRLVHLFYHACVFRPGLRLGGFGASAGMNQSRPWRNEPGTRPAAQSCRTR